jgi:Zn-finger nucleic acid-binding protein
MHGSFAGRFIVDRCDKCGGVWMSAEEIERLSYERNVGNVMHYHYMAAEFVDSLLKLAGKSPY